MATQVEIDGNVALRKELEHLLMTNPDTEKVVQNIIRKVLKEARNKVSYDAGSYIENDPRKAARAVKHSVYKQILGGNISILQKRKAGPKSDYTRQHTLRPSQVGGNRRPRIESRNRLDKYYGSDRGFILRFLQSGTVNRDTRFGNRGAIRAIGWFNHVATWHMETAAKQVAEAISEYIIQQTQ